MFTLTYLELRNPHFITALEHMANSTRFGSAKVAYDIGQISKEIVNGLKLCQDEFLGILKKFAVLDDKGNFVPMDNKPDTYQIAPDKMDNWKKTVEEFQVQTVSIHRHKVSLEVLSPVGLTPNQILALEPILLTVPHSVS